METRKFAILRCQWEATSTNAVLDWPIWSDADVTALFGGPFPWSIASFWQACTYGLLRPQFEVVGRVSLAGTQGPNQTRGQILALAQAAAQRAHINLSGYVGLMAFVEPPPNDAGGFAASPHAVLDGFGYIEFYDHEVGHMLLFEHAWGPNGAYDDNYCVMGFTDPQSHNLTPAAPFKDIKPLHPKFWQEGRRASGATLYRYLDAYRNSASVVKMPAMAQGDVQLVAMSEASIGDPTLLVCDEPGGEFTVEHRTNTKLDSGVTPAVVIHSFGRHALPQSAGEVRPTWFESAMPAPYDTRTTIGNRCLEVLSRSNDGRRVTVRVTRPFPLPPGRASGAMIQSEYGLGNDELLVCRTQSRLSHYWRDHGQRSLPWHVGHEYVLQSSAPNGSTVATVGLDPMGVSMVRSTIRGDGHRGNFDAVVRIHPHLDAARKGDYLAFAAFDTATNTWQALSPVVADGQVVNGVTGHPALVQSEFGTVGNYEMLVPVGSDLRHFWRDNDAVGFPWHAGHSYHFAASSAGPGQVAQAVQLPLGVALLVSSIKGDGKHGNFDFIVRMHSPIDPTLQGTLHFGSFDTAQMQWTSVRQIEVDGRPLAGATGDPALVQSNFGTRGNYEMLVPAGNELRHYWRNNDDATFAWHAGHVYQLGGSQAGGVGQAMAAMDVVGVTMLVGSIAGDLIHGNFEAVVHLRPRLDRGGGDRLCQCRFDTATGAWTAITDVVADGRPVDAVVSL